MNSGGGLITNVNQKLSDQSVTDQIRAMHANQTPLIDMVETLGLAGDMSDAVRGIVAGLGPDVVAGIRQATLEMLDGPTRRMPVDCNLSQTEIDGGAPVNVSVVVDDSQQTILVRAQ
jgi:hypothetical protein